MTELPTAEHLPSSLTATDQWVCWQTETRDGKQTKIPIDPTTGRYASTRDPATWSTFEEARACANASTAVEGVGFVFTDDDPFVGVDLDDCRANDELSADWAADIIDRLDSYTEVSPSGTGYHVIVIGELPAGANRRGDIECYETARYFTVTGESVHDPPRPIAERTVELDAVHADYVAGEPADHDAVETPISRRTSESETGSGLDDETVLEKATSAANGAKFERLWNGSTSGYDSQSEADMALCFHLAFWTGGDTAQIDRLFRRSGLMREKWDEVHFSDGSTYGEKTVERAVARVDEFYEPTATDTEGFGDVERGVDGRRASARRGMRQETDTRAQKTGHGEQRLLTIIDRLEARVKRLEAENEELRRTLEANHDGNERRQGSPDETASDSTSLWGRMASRLRRT